MGSLLLTAGEKGMRFSLPSSGSWFTSLQAVTKASDGHRDPPPKKRKLKIGSIRSILKYTGQNIETVVEGLERDNFMDAEQARWGLIGKIIKVDLKRTQNNKKKDLKDIRPRKRAECQPG